MAKPVIIAIGGMSDVPAKIGLVTDVYEVGHGNAESASRYRTVIKLPGGEKEHRPGRLGDVGQDICIPKRGGWGEETRLALGIQAGNWFSADWQCAIHNETVRLMNDPKIRRPGNRRARHALQSRAFDAIWYGGRRTKPLIRNHLWGQIREFAGKRPKIFYATSLGTPICLDLLHGRATQIGRVHSVILTGAPVAAFLLRRWNDPRKEYTPPHCHQWFNIYDRRDIVATTWGDLIEPSLLHPTDIEVKNRLWTLRPTQRLMRAHTGYPKNPRVRALVRAVLRRAAL